MEKLTLVLLLLFLVSACEENQDPEEAVFTEIPAPVVEGAESNIFVDEEGQAYLSWIEYVDDTTDALLFSRLSDDRWNEPLQVAEGADWFVNWADFPSIATFSNQPEIMAAHWLQKSAEGTYDYDVRISISKDKGQQWSPSFILHQDGIPAEHGFVTLLPLENGRMFATWLDGRKTKGEHASKDEHAHSGSMTLRTAEFDTDGRLYEQAELDGRVCDCCQTDAALTSAGPIVVYRDRSEEEIRDISIVRKVNGTWTAPQPLSDDNWEIAACPVNGPAIVAEDRTVAIAWFTAADGTPQVKVAFSRDAGKTFSDAYRIDDGNPIGRVDIVLKDAETALVSWVEQIDQQGEIRLAEITNEGQKNKSFTAAQTGLSRKYGFPILEKQQEQYLLSWTSGEEVSRVSTARLRLE